QVRLSRGLTATLATSDLAHAHRLAVRVQHPQPATGHTALARNRDGDRRMLASARGIAQQGQRALSFIGEKYVERSVAVHVRHRNRLRVEDAVLEAGLFRD